MIVIKFGGHAMDSDPIWMEEIARRWSAGEQFVIVHGGGPQIDQQLKIEGVESEFKDGFRITTPPVMKVVEAVLTGSVLRSVVRSLQRVGLPAIGITGSDAGLLSVGLRDNGALGLVGEVESVNPKILKTLLDSGFLPVVAPVSNAADGTALNVNADLAAGAIAGALGAQEVLFMTDVPGIYRSWPDQNSLMNEVSAKELGSIAFEGGMVPKVTAVINAITSGAKSARVIDGKSLGAFKDALSGRGGTWVRA
jgi:acetylglutamate kinase